MLFCKIYSVCFTAVLWHLPVTVGLFWKDIHIIEITSAGFVHSEEEDREREEERTEEELREKKKEERWEKGRGEEKSKNEEKRREKTTPSKTRVQTA